MAGAFRQGCPMPRPNRGVISVLVEVQRGLHLVKCSAVIFLKFLIFGYPAVWFCVGLCRYGAVVELEGCFPRRL